MRQKDFSHPVFKPLWVRLLVVVACAGWAGLEVYLGNSGWALFFVVIAIVAGYHFATIDYSDMESD